MAAIEPSIEFVALKMTPRELFAAMAMQGLYAGYYAHAEGVRGVREAARSLNVSDSEMIAKAAIDGADALLAELAK